MSISRLEDVYSPAEIASAAGASTAEVRALVGGPEVLVSFPEAVRIGRTLVARRQAGAAPHPIFSRYWTDAAAERPRSVPLVVSSTVHLTILGVAILVATLGLTSKAAMLPDDHLVEPMRLVFLAIPGPGGGGGGGGLLQKAPPPKAEREGHRSMSSPIPARVPPKPIEPAPKPPEPKPAPLNAEQLPVVVAPIVTAPADSRTRIGVLEQSTADDPSHGAGKGGGVGTGTGTGLGEGDGSGIGPGSGGGTGGGPYRPGSGITPPRLLREVKADYTEEARRRALSGEVVMEIVVRRDGTVGDARVLQGLGSGLDERAVQAVRQWRFAPASRQGAPVDVIVEVAVEFRLR